MIKLENEHLSIEGNAIEILSEITEILKGAEEVLEKNFCAEAAREMVDEAINLYKDSLAEDKHSQGSEYLDDIMNNLIKEVHDLHDELIGMLGRFK